MEKKLKPKQYYLDLYDRHTVELCRGIIRIHSEPMKNPPLFRGKKPPEGLVKAVSGMALNYSLMFEKGGRYLEKERAIEKWMAEDEEKDRFYEATEAPDGVRCLKCDSEMHILHKDLRTELHKPNRVLFMFDCPNKCFPRRMFWDNGDEWVPKQRLCPKCGTELDSQDTITKKKFIVTYRCASCGFAKTDELDRTAHEKEKPDPDFEKDRAQFCLSKEEGEKWRQSLLKMEQMKRLVDEWKERDKNKEVYDRVAKLKKLTVVDLEKLLAPALEKSGYVHFKLADPEVDKIVAVPFTTQDAKSEREKLASEYDLKRFIKKILEDTNWRLMTDGVSYRLGILSGRLRGYENEEDLVKLVT